MTGGGEILAAVIEVLTVMIAGTGEGRHQSLITSATTETISRALTPDTTHHTLPTCSSGNADIPQ